MKDIQDVINQIKSIIDLNKKINPDYYKNNSLDKIVRQVLEMFNIDDEKSFKIVIEEIEAFLTETPEPVVISTHKPGWVKDSFISDKYDKGLWERYREYLIQNNKSFNVDSLDKITDKILNYVHDPRDTGEWSRRGMVVGHVQSGKTSNYIGLINKAIGHGYRLVIVLTGMYDDLRMQTQERIDYGIIGKLSAHTNEKNKGDKVGVGLSKIQTKTSIQSLTSLMPSKEGDFTDAPTTHFAEGSSHTFIMAVKKNKHILERVIKWLTSLADKETGLVKNIPTLIIDDEADSASVNSAKIDEDPKTINRLIRVILNMTEKVSFVGYTATPYANIFINAQADERKVNLNGKEYDISKDLFPEDFIINLKPSPLYFGPHKLFGEENNYPLVNILENYYDDYREIFPPSIKTETELPGSIPESLEEAVIHFLLAAIIREKRDGIKKHNSMLIHVSLRVVWIDRVARLTEELLGFFSSKTLAGNGRFKKRVLEVFNNIVKTSEIINSMGNEFDLEPFYNFEEIWMEFNRAIEYTEVVAVHGGFNDRNLVQEHENTDFEYGEIPRFYILVGGNRLSRGITLEGLTTSYFVRVSKMYDSLMQMGRWFGYKGNYLDLCRLYTSDELKRWYGFITQATDELREEFNQLNYRITPRNYSLRIQKFPGQLKITSLGRMRNSKVMKFSFNGRVAVTNIFEDLPEVHEKNIKNLFSVLGRTDHLVHDSKSSNLYWKNVSSDVITDLLINFEVHPDIYQKHLLLIDFIKINSDKYYNGFNIVLINVSDKNKRVSRVLEIKNKESFKIFGLKRKPEINGENFLSYVNYFKLNKDGLTSGRDKYFDLETDYGITDTVEAKKKRDEIKTPLLLLYLIDGKLSLNREGPEFEYCKKLKLNSDNVIIPAYYFVFPKMSENQVIGADYVVNLIDEKIEFDNYAE